MLNSEERLKILEHTVDRISRHRYYEEDYEAHCTYTHLLDKFDKQEKKLAQANAAVTLLLKELEWRIRSVEETVKGA